MPVVRGTNLANPPFDLTDLVFVSEAKADALSRSLAHPGDIVVTQRGTLGQVGRIPEGPYDRWVISQSQMALKVDRAVASADFVYICLRSPAVQEEIRNRAIITGVPHINLGIFAELEIPLPPIEEQQRIASVLGALDAKIVSNRRVAAAAEELTSALFRSWFIDFDPVHAKATGLAPRGVPKEVTDLLPDSFEGSEIGPIPVGWTLRALSEIGRFVNGGALTKGATGSGRVIVRIAEMKGGIGGGTKYTDAEVPDDQVARPGDILFAWSGSLCAMRWTLPEAVINQHIFKCIPNDGVPGWVLEGFLQRAMPEFVSIAADKATTMGHIRRGDLDSPKGALPPPEVMDALNEIAEPLHSLRMSMRTEAHTLEAVRDALLPKLVSGQLRVEQDGAQAA